MRKILAGRVYRHFKGKDYKVLVVAQHTETGEQCVVYQALYDDCLLYTSPSPRDRTRSRMPSSA